MYMWVAINKHLFKQEWDNGFFVSLKETPFKNFLSAFDPSLLTQQLKEKGPYLLLYVHQKI